MVSSIKCVVFLLALTSSVFGQIDLTPIDSKRELEGVKFVEVLFRDGKRTISYEPPTGWTYSGTATRFILHPPGKTQAEASIELLDLGQPPIPGEERLKQLKETALHLVPKGADSVEVVGEEQGPVHIDGKDTFGVTIKYTFYGQPFQMSILFFDFANSELRFRLQSQSSDFQELQKAFGRSLFSWQWLPIGR